MGSLQAIEFASMVEDQEIGLDTALTWHLRSNHFPPVPLTMLKPCKLAISAATEGKFEKLIKLPKGTSWRGEPKAPAWAIVEGHHLDAFVSRESDEDY